MPIYVMGPDFDAKAYERGEPQPAGDAAMVTTYVGAVIDVYERNMYDDSDFYAVVWDEPSQSVKTIEYATTRGWCYPNGATVDATPEVLAKFRTYCAARILEASLAQYKRHANRPAVGDTVMVVRGRKVPLGTIARVVHVQDNPYYRDYAAKYASGYVRHVKPPEAFTIVIETARERWFTSMNNVEKLAVALPDVADFRRRAEQSAAGMNGRSYAWIGRGYVG